MAQLSPKGHAEAMSTDLPPAGPPSGSPADARQQRGHHPATPGQLAWLGHEVAGWKADGVITDDQATLLLGRYHAVRRLELSRIALWLGAGFVGIGIIWLVAANLDQLPPRGRFAAVTLLWLGSLVAAEVLDRRIRTRRSPVVGAARGLAALLYGAVIMQAAQSLQVPAYDAKLIGIWAAGALLYAYAVRGTAPLVVGVLLGSGWLLWHTGEALQRQPSFVLALGALAMAGLALGRLHDSSPDAAGWGRFGTVWRFHGAITGLAALFVAALPWGDGDTRYDAWLVGALVAAALLAGAAALRSSGPGRLEAVSGVVILALAMVLTWWSPESVDVGDKISGAAWAHAIVSIIFFVAAAAGVAAIGVLRDEAPLTWIGVAALAVFTTVQSFAVFAQVITGAWLFVVLGLVFAGTGWVADRARREMVEALEGADR
jgi:uncharacterized membrane protein